MHKRSAVVLGMLLSAAITVAAAATQPKGVTFADLQKNVSAAVAKSWSVDPARVSRLLARPGIEPGSIVTEGMAVEIFRNLGVDAGTKQPDRVLTTQRLDALVQRFTSTFAAAPAVRPAEDLPPGIEACYSASNHGTCVNCCKELGGGGSACARACFVINKPSASEPLP